MPEKSVDLFELQGEAPKARHIYSVGEITRDIKLILENTFAGIWVEGEVSGLRKSSKGTVFFSLKDNTALLKCVIFSSYAACVKFEIKDGMKLVCLGRISVYEKDGSYQLSAQEIEPKGIGGIQLALEQLKERLEKEGLFNPAHKRKLPYLPSRIGIVTSAQGAAIKDILKVLGARFKDVNIIVSSVQVQGDGAKEEIAQAIREFNVFNEQQPLRERIDVMIVGRGGGSIEDLWAFNEEIVARAIYNSKIPVISAVGHERDWTIADLTADLRAATPSAAAEIVMPRKEDLNEKLGALENSLKRRFLDTVFGFEETGLDLAHRLNLNMEHILEISVTEFNAATKKLALVNPAVIIQQYKTKTLDLAKQIYSRFGNFIKLKEAQFTKAVEKLSGLSPLNILSRGYSITFKMPEGAIIKEASAVKAGDTIRTNLHNGRLLSKVTEVE